MTTMFEVPEAKRIRREDLIASDDDVESKSDDGVQDAELRARLNAQIARSLGLDDSYTNSSSDIPRQGSHPEEQEELGGHDIGDVEPADAAEDDHEEEFAFRLFSKAPPTQKVVLEDDAEPLGNGGLISGRPLSYYVATNVSAQRKQEYALTAISGDQVLTKSHDRAWGLELPWKVTKLTVTRTVSLGDETEQEDADKGKRRPGKKQRISLRKRAKVKEEKKAVEAQKMAEKEEHIKDKKKRMNRLKKLRKRAKAREQKQGGKGGEGEDSDGDSAGSE
ncbi:hypothetical protein F66182_2036 [Fusarium sp. NRRL 66182]|nr:hypothetical protein F66182_2036 [Fusarium sp. NRRL 66182]